MATKKTTAKQKRTVYQQAFSYATRQAMKKSNYRKVWKNEYSEFLKLDDVTPKKTKRK